MGAASSTGIATATVNIASGASGVTDAGAGACPPCASSATRAATTRARNRRNASEIRTAPPGEVNVQRILVGTAVSVHSGTVPVVDGPLRWAHDTSSLFSEAPLPRGNRVGDSGLDRDDHVRADTTRRANRNRYLPRDVRESAARPGRGSCQGA